MEEIYKAYLQYDFNNSEEFKDFNEKFPLEPNETIEEHKKRFYKSHICREFDVNYRPSQSSNINNSNPNNRRNSNNINNNQRNNNLSNIPPFFEIIDFSLLGLSLIILPTSICYYLFELMIYFIYRLYFATGIPRFSIEYLKLIIHHNNFNYFVLCFILWMTKTYNILIILPMTIYTGLYLIRGINKYFKNNLFDKIIRYNTYIKESCLYFELINLILSFVGIFFGLNKFYFIFIYLQYIKFRYYASEEMRGKINAIRVKLETMRSNPNSPFLSGLAGIIQKIGNALSNGFYGGNVVMVNGGIMACNIF